MDGDKSMQVKPMPGTAEAGQGSVEQGLGCTGETDGTFLREMLSGDLLAVSGAVGTEAALRIMLALGGSTLYIPLPEELVRALRDEKLRRMHALGKPVRELSRMFRLSARMVYNVIKSPSAGISPALERALEAIISECEAGRDVDGA